MRILKTTVLLGSLLMITQVHAHAVWQGSATLIIKKSRVADFKKAVAKIIEPTKQEAGCISYTGYMVMDEKGQETNRFEFHEIWRTKEAMLIDHKENSPHMKAFFQEIKADTEDSYLESFELDGKYVTLL